MPRFYVAAGALKSNPHLVQQVLFSAKPSLQPLNVFIDDNSWNPEEWEGSLKGDGVWRETGLAGREEGPWKCLGDVESCFKPGWGVNGVISQYMWTHLPSGIFVMKFPYLELVKRLRRQKVLALQPKDLGLVGGIHTRRREPYSWKLSSELHRHTDGQTETHTYHYYHHKFLHLT